MPKRIRKKLVIIILGPPGSGKGTQAELLAEKFNLLHLETSELIEEKLADIKRNDFVLVKGKKYFLFKQKKIRESGGLMSDPLITFWMENEIKESAKRGKGIVMSGFPRTLYEVEKSIPIFKNLYGKDNIKIFLFKLTPKESIYRNSHRKTCQLMRHTLLYTKGTNQLKRCPFDGSKLVIRKDDSPRIIKIRLKEYKERTFPLIDYFKKEKIKIIEIDGSPTPAEIFKNILKKIKI